MGLVARLYLSFREEYNKQSEIQVEDRLNNAVYTYTYRRESITILGTAIFVIEQRNMMMRLLTFRLQIKGGLKISILNLLKLTSKFLIG